MKNLILFVVFFSSITIYSQRSEDYTKLVEQLKANAQVDKNDKTVFNILNDFYDQVLQSDLGELKADIPERIQKIYADKNAKNIQILKMFLVYQDHISQTAAVGKQPDTNFQVNLMTDLEDEVKSVYGKVPVIIEIYKAEALKSNGQGKESADLISRSFKKFPDSVPLKVYEYLNTKDEKIKKDLITNHANHWMVQQFEIKV